MMNTKVNVLLAPKIEEAVGDKLSVGKLVNVATGDSACLQWGEDR